MTAIETGVLTGSQGQVTGAITLPNGHTFFAVITDGDIYRVTATGATPVVWLNDALHVGSGLGAGLVALACLLFVRRARGRRAQLG